MNKDQVDALWARIMDQMPKPQDCLCTVITRAEHTRIAEKVRQVLRDTLGALHERHRSRQT